MSSSDLNKMAEQIVEQISAKIRKEAYREGWKDAMASAAKIASDALNRHPIETLPLFPTETKSNPFRHGTDMAKLFDYMKNNQGLTGAELIMGIKNAGVEIEEKTARTALHRIRKRGFADTIERKWYVK